MIAHIEKILDEIFKLDRTACGFYEPDLGDPDGCHNCHYVNPIECVRFQISVAEPEKLEYWKRLLIRELSDMQSGGSYCDAMFDTLNRIEAELRQRQRHHQMKARKQELIREISAMHSGDPRCEGKFEELNRIEVQLRAFAYPGSHEALDEMRCVYAGPPL